MARQIYKPRASGRFPGRVGGGEASRATHPPSSFFQIGARALISSMISRAPANASARWGAETAIATDGSDSADRPDAVLGGRRAQPVALDRLGDDPLHLALGHRL